MTREETLRVFEGLLAAERPVNAGEADAVIWAYLDAVEGLTGQRTALAELERGVAGLDAGSAFMPILLDTLERHRARLGEPQG
ncbi:hypothetical protein [Methylobacterium radiodurans]|uniref:Uncharacterized protein n=1 Tax=Methylobacterium radiodurans TaxID=2202828 RepID=A0A2U8VMH5_9HYPH|nr:hypothetical protein [Methylobacterium radiodurans]AWN34803.1 hypothetical protein DK427_02810 [Methylobacterium radiodurans]